jgi:hypothetical protein
MLNAILIDSVLVGAARPPCRGPQRPNGTKTYPIILLLSLVRRLVGKLDHPGPGTKLKELDPPKRLGERVRKLALGVNVACLDCSLPPSSLGCSGTSPDALASFMENGVLCHG